MAKMFFSLGFWMTIVLFIALGYALGALGYSFGADRAGSMNCAARQSARASSMLADENRGLQSDLRASDVFPRSAPNARH